VSARQAGRQQPALAGGAMQAAIGGERLVRAARHSDRGQREKQKHHGAEHRSFPVWPFAASFRTILVKQMLHERQNRTAQLGGQLDQAECNERAGASIENYADKALHVKVSVFGEHPYNREHNLEMRERSGS
jgi:hypothetical protein